MKIILIGVPKSGRTIVANALCKDGKFNYIDAVSELKSSCKQELSDTIESYDEKYHRSITETLIRWSRSISNYVLYIISYYNNKNYVIDGIFSPKDFIDLFDYNNDIVVFLNRIENDSDHKDYENIGVSVIRDYCFWLSSANLLKKEQWLEYNFKIPGEDSDTVKVLGSKNSVFIIKSINKVISHLENYLATLRYSSSK